MRLQETSRTQATLVRNQMKVLKNMHGGDDMGFDEDDEHAKDDVRDDHGGVAVAVTMSEVAREDEAGKAKAERYLQTKRNFNRGVGNFNAVGKAVRYKPPPNVCEMSPHRWYRMAWTWTPSDRKFRM